MNVRRATVADLPAVAEVLAAAFDGDPPWRWFAPEPDLRPALLRRFFVAALPLYLRHGSVWVAERPFGAAAWVAPGRWPFSARDQAPALPTLVRVFGRHPLRAVRGIATIERGHPHAPHWYLDYIGVDPGAQGGGAGSALLAPMLERCDTERAAAYLNAGSWRSRDLYARHGFEVRERFELPYGGPSLWRMWREPR